MKCNKCDNPAEYDSPEHLCELCWANWWVDGLLRGGKTHDENGNLLPSREELLAETLDICKNDK